MSRSNYSDDCENLGLWRGAVQRATFGYRGQAFLRKLRDALDAMPDKRLIADAIKDEHGNVCALGAVDPTVEIYHAEELAEHFGIARALAAEIVYINDERGEGDWVRGEGPAQNPWGYPPYVWVACTPEERWRQVRAWVGEQIIGEA